LKKGPAAAITSLLLVALGLALFLGMGSFSRLAMPNQSSSARLNQSGSSMASGVLGHSHSTYGSNSLTGLRLGLIATSNANGSVTVAIDEYNTLLHSNNVSVAHDWPNASLFQWSRVNCESNYLNLPAGYEILQGNYGKDNFTQGAPLWLQPMTFLPSCPLTEGPVLYSFLPTSDYSSTIGGNVSASGTWPGYYIGMMGGGVALTRGGDCPGAPPLNSYSACSLTFVPFPPGVYTVVAADEWGQVEVLHFSITN